MNIETILDDCIQASFNACDTGDPEGKFTQQVQTLRSRILRVDAEKDAKINGLIADLEGASQNYIYYFNRCHESLVALAKKDNDLKWAKRNVEVGNMYIDDLKEKLAAKDIRIAELEKQNEKIRTLMSDVY